MMTRIYVSASSPLAKKREGERFLFEGDVFLIFTAIFSYKSDSPFSEHAVTLTNDYITAMLRRLTGSL